MAQPCIGVVGLGQIGLQVALRLLAEGHDVIGFRRSGSPELEAAGGRLAGSAREVAEVCETVIQCLPSEAALEDAGFGPAGVLRAARPGLTVIELSTYPVETKLRYNAALVDAGADFVEVEVSGPPPLVVARKAALFAAGDEGTVERVVPLLEKITGPVLFVGPIGSAFALKLVANHLVAVNTAATAEAMALADALGVDPERTIEVIGKSAGGSVMFSLRAPMMADGTTEAGLGPVQTLSKYLDYIRQTSEAVALDLTLFDAADTLYRRALETGLGDHDIAVVHQLVGRRA